MIRKAETKKERKEIRHRRIRTKIFGVPEKPRLSVYKSNKYIYAQLINDVEGKTLLAIDSRKMKDKRKKERKCIIFRSTVAICPTEQALERMLISKIMRRGSLSRRKLLARRNERSE